MELVYNTKNRMLKNMNGDTVADLSEREGQLIEVLCNNKVNTWKEIINYVYGYDTKYQDHYMHRMVTLLKYRLRKKIKLNIKGKSYFGYELKDDIYIE